MLRTSAPLIGALGLNIMRLYRYMSLQNLWYVLEVIHLNRVHCAHWEQLNDPMEGNYELCFKGDERANRATLESKLKENRDKHRIASFSESSTDFLLWSHYADGHKGVALELNIDKGEPTLSSVT